MLFKTYFSSEILEKSEKQYDSQMSKRDSNSYINFKEEITTVPVMDQKAFLAKIELELRFWAIIKTWMDRKKNTLSRGENGRNKGQEAEHHMLGLTSVMWPNLT